MRKRAIIAHTLIWAAIVAFTAWTWRQSPPVPPPPWVRAGVTLLKDVIYRQDGTRKLALDVYFPPGAPDRARPRPAVIAVHGGSWIGGSRLAVRIDSRSTFTRLAEHGLVVAVVDYRLARPRSPSWPEVIEDLRESVRWVRRHAGRLGVDPNRIAALGQSSGAHLAALLATLPDQAAADGVSARVQSVVCFYAPFDLPSLVKQRHLDHEPAATFLGTKDAALGDTGKMASPIEHVTSDDPPMLLLHGSGDLWVLPEQSRRMASALDQAGVANRLIIVKGALHGFEALVEAPERRDLLPEVLSFLEASWAAK